MYHLMGIHRFGPTFSIPLSLINFTPSRTNYCPILSLDGPEVSNGGHVTQIQIGWFLELVMGLKQGLPEPKNICPRFSNTGRK